jgi:hypothetical protein
MRMLRAGALAFAAAVLIEPVLAQSPATGETRWSSLSADLNCGQMKQRVDAILSSNTTYKDPITGGGANLNNSGITAHSVAARKEIAAGDEACSEGNPDLARPRYQRAMDELTATQ